jgi:hypothetical protein
MLSVIGAVGQAEREAMLERQRQADRSRQMKAEGVRVAEMASRLGIGMTSVYRVLGEQSAKKLHDRESAEPRVGIIAPRLTRWSRMPCGVDMTFEWYG